MDKVLIIEDHDHIRLYLKTILELNGYLVIEADNGFTGLKKITENNDLKLILLDLMMPVVDGEFLLNNLKQSGFPCKICVLSAKNDKETIEKITNLGISEYLSKPVDKTMLLEKIKQNIKGGTYSSFISVKADLIILIEDFPVKNNFLQVVDISEVGCKAISNFEISKESILNISSDDFKQHFGLDNVKVKVENCTFLGKDRYEVFLIFIGMNERERDKIRKITIKGRPINVEEAS